MDPFEDPTRVSPAVIAHLVRAQRMLLEGGYRYFAGETADWPLGPVEMEREGVHLLVAPAVIARLADIRKEWASLHADLGPSVSLLLIGDLDCRETTIFKFLESAPGCVAYVDVQGRAFHLRRPWSPWAGVPRLLRKTGLRRLLAGPDRQDSLGRCRAALEKDLRENDENLLFVQQARQAAGSEKPLLTYSLMTSWAAVFVLMFLAAGPAMLGSPSTEILLRWGADFGRAVAAGQYWRMITCAFVHVGLLHLLLNLMGAYYFAGPLEFYQGRWRLAVYFLFGTLAGSLASLWYHPMTVSAGASGGLFGLVGAMLGMLLRYHLDIPSALRHAMRQWLLTVLLYNAVFLIDSAVFPVGRRVDSAAHIGGFLGGLAISLALARSPIRRHRPGLVGIALAVALTAGLAALAVHVVRYLYALHGGHL